MGPVIRETVMHKEDKEIIYEERRTEKLIEKKLF